VAIQTTTQEKPARRRGVYGSSKAGIRFAAVGINVLSIGLIVWMIHLFTKDNYNFLLLVIMATMALFSLFKREPRRTEMR